MQGGFTRCIKPKALYRDRFYVCYQLGQWDTYIDFISKRAPTPDHGDRSRFPLPHVWQDSVCHVHHAEEVDAKELLHRIASTRPSNITQREGQWLTNKWTYPPSSSVPSINCAALFTSTSILPQTFILSFTFSFITSKESAISNFKTCNLSVSGEEAGTEVLSSTGSCEKSFLGSRTGAMTKSPRAKTRLTSDRPRPELPPKTHSTLSDVIDKMRD